MGTGHRADVLEQEAAHGPARARELFDLAEEAKRHLHEFTAARAIDMGFVPGQLSVAHLARHVRGYRAWADALRERYDYPHMTFMDREETAARLGSTRYHGGVRDVGTGHIDPARLVVGAARAAADAGARLHERTRVTAVEPHGAGVRVLTERGVLTADRALVAVNGYGAELQREAARHVMPIRSFIGASEPLEDETVLPGGEAVDDSRFVVRYFRRVTWPDGRSRLLFGGRETYTHPRDTAAPPRDLHRGIRRQIAEVYPRLADVPLTPRLGRVGGNHGEPRALRARGRAARARDRGLLGPRRHAVELHGPALRGGGGGQPRQFGGLRGTGAPAVPGRHARAPSPAAAGDELVRAARPVLTSTGPTSVEATPSAAVRPGPSPPA